MAPEHEAAAATRPDGLEGALTVRIERAADASVQACLVESSRPDIAATMLQGRGVDAIALAVPRLFAICGVAQGVACRLALDAATSAVPGADRRAGMQAAVRAETLRETARRLLLDAPRAAGDAPDPLAVAAVRSAMGPAPDAALLAQALFGEPLADWLARDTADTLQAWARAGVTGPARQLHALWKAEPSRAVVAMLPGLSDASLLQSIARSAVDEPTFARAPTLDGEPRETGALARQRADVLVRGLLAAWPAHRALARQAARLRELAALVGIGPGLGPVVGDVPGLGPVVGSAPLAEGWGLGWVETARGLLVHLAQVQGGRAVRYRIVAPTEWNFHPRGALAAAAVGWPAQSARTLRNRMAQEIESLDPCVRCEIQVPDA